MTVGHYFIPLLPLTILLWRLAHALQRRLELSRLARIVGDTIPLGYKTLRVVELRDDVVDEEPVLVVEDVSE
jgi:hypothetical protein